MIIQGRCDFFYLDQNNVGQMKCHVSKTKSQVSVLKTTDLKLSQPELSQNHETFLIIITLPCTYLLLCCSYDIMHLIFKAGVRYVCLYCGYRPCQEFFRHAWNPVTLESEFEPVWVYDLASWGSIYRRFVTWFNSLAYLIQACISRTRAS